MAMRSVFLVFSSGLLLLACREDIPPPPPPAPVPVVEEIQIPEGTYKGTFTVQYSDTTYTNITTVEFTDSTFSNHKAPNNMPLGGIGVYEVYSDTIEFNQNAYWPAIFDWQLYLDGKYKFTLNGNALNFYKISMGSTYTYDLILQ